MSQNQTPEAEIHLVFSNVEGESKLECKGKGDSIVSLLLLTFVKSPELYNVMKYAVEVYSENMDEIKNLESKS